ncbi:hypothetical protein QUF54_05950, partial [Candidatus Marithioploca araucensis]|nr:hypothetical protein [Candidatus Marithioploca araucensis]
EVYLAEMDYVKKKRENMNLSTETVDKESERIRLELKELRESKPDTDEVPRLNVRISTDADLVGVALSGGGVRSATFNLGLLQGLDKGGILRYCDYLSTVSGGGYIGSCLSSLLTNPEASTDSSSKEKLFPFRFHRDSESDEHQEVNYHLQSAQQNYEERLEVSYLRAAKNYLGLDGGLFHLETWRFIMMFLSGVVLINIVPLIFLILASYGLYLVESNMLTAFYSIPQINEMGEVVNHIWKFDKETTFFNFHSLTALLLQFALYSFGVMVIIRGLSVFFNLNTKLIRNLQAWLGIITVVLLVFVGLISFTFYLFLDEYGKVDEQISALLNYTLLATVLFFILGRLNAANQFVQKFLNMMLFFALVALFPIIFAQFLRLLWTHYFFVSVFDFMPLPIFVAIILFAISLMININRVSLHAFYREGLSKTYMIKRENGKIKSNEGIKLKALHTHYNGPYHLINATLNLQGSKNRHLSGRGADYFIFSKHYCGAESTGYRSTESYDNGETKLAKAMAISGAAASPSMGTQTNLLIAFYMILFNIRLNVWMPNPNPKYMVKRFTIWPRYFLKEFVPLNKEENSQLNLSDGGHHENLGIYSLLKRRCRLIIASEASSDPDYKMNDLANLKRKARIDLGINVELDMTPLRPNKDGFVEKHYVKGIIHYPNEKNGVLFYIKTSMTGKEPEDLLSYRRKSPSFPDETTANQFFNEAQFESYRKLGEVVGKEVCADIEEEIQRF